MENIYFLLSAHQSCVEGIQLIKKNNKLHAVKKISGFGKPVYSETESEEKVLSDLEKWGNELCDFLDKNQWSDHAISLLLPAEDITFRKLKYPFQERKKVISALPFDLEEELIGELEDSIYSADVHPLTENESEAVVLLMDRQKIELIQQICIDRDLLIRNVDCSAHALYRSLTHDPATLSATNRIFQIYLGADEAFINTIADGHLDEIKIFSSRIPELLSTILTEENASFSTFIERFGQHISPEKTGNKDSEKPDELESIKQELVWLCAQLTRHLRMKNYNSESEILIHGFFGPAVKWDGIVLKLRKFPLAEVNEFSEKISGFADEDEIEDVLLDDALVQLDDNQGVDEENPESLDELLAAARKRENEDQEISDNNKVEISESLSNPPMVKQGMNQLAALNPESSFLSLRGREHWGVLGEVVGIAQKLTESHVLSLYHEVTPWKRFLSRNKGAVAVALILLLVISASFAGQSWLNLNLLKQEIARHDNLIQTELKRALPESSAKSVQGMLAELTDKISQQESKIEISKTFHQRDYQNLRFLRKLSMLLDDGAPFQVDSLEYAPERFSLSGTIDSYDSLQLLKNRLKEMEEFKNKRIVESNRKSSEGIVYRISIDLNTKNK